MIRTSRRQSKNRENIYILRSLSFTAYTGFARNTHTHIYIYITIPLLSPVWVPAKFIFTRVADETVCCQPGRLYTTPLMYIYLSNTYISALVRWCGRKTHGAKAEREREIGARKRYTHSICRASVSFFMSFLPDPPIRV